MSYKHSQVVDAEPILRLSEPTESLDPALADLRGFMPQVTLEPIPDHGTVARRQFLEGRGGGRRQDELIAHLAKI